MRRKILWPVCVIGAALLLIATTYTLMRFLETSTRSYARYYAYVGYTQAGMCGICDRCGMLQFGHDHMILGLRVLSSRAGTMVTTSNVLYAESGCAPCAHRWGWLTLSRHGWGQSQGFDGMLGPDPAPPKGTPAYARALEHMKKMATDDERVQFLKLIREEGPEEALQSIPPQ